MTVTYKVLSEANGQAEVEFTEKETKLSQKRQINIIGLSDADKIKRYEDHQRAFVHRLGLGMIKAPEAEKPTSVLDTKTVDTKVENKSKKK